jgi:hypothetical protein
LQVAYLICNQSPPTDGQPSLMSLREVETLFHEFGHGLQVRRAVGEPLESRWRAVGEPSESLLHECGHGLLAPTYLPMPSLIALPSFGLTYLPTLLVTSSRGLQHMPTRVPHVELLLLTATSNGSLAALWRLL